MPSCNFFAGPKDELLLIKALFKVGATLLPGGIFPEYEYPQIQSIQEYTESRETEAMYYIYHDDNIQSPLMIRFLEGKDGFFISTGRGGPLGLLFLTNMEYSQRERILPYSFFDFKFEHRSSINGLITPVKPLFKQMFIILAKEVEKHAVRKIEIENAVRSFWVMPHAEELNKTEGYTLRCDKAIKK